MQTITLRVEDSVSEKFLWLLEHFDEKEISIIDKIGKMYQLLFSPQAKKDLEGLA